MNSLYIFLTGFLLGVAFMALGIHLEGREEEGSAIDIVLGGVLRLTSIGWIVMTLQYISAGLRS